MTHVTGIGGVFFRARDPEGLRAWYRRHLGIATGPGGGAVFAWGDRTATGQVGSTVWALFAADSRYLGDGPASFMINYRVVDLDGLLLALRRDGVQVDDRIAESEFGRFAWVTDPEGNRIELWEPAAGQ